MASRAVSVGWQGSQCWLEGQSVLASRSFLIIARSVWVSFVIFLGRDKQIRLVSDLTLGDVQVIDKSQGLTVVLFLMLLL